MACDSGVGRLGFLEGSERSVESGLGCTGLGPGSSLSGSPRGAQSGFSSCDRHVTEGGETLEIFIGNHDKTKSEQRCSRELCCDDECKSGPFQGTRTTRPPTWQTGGCLGRPGTGSEGRLCLSWSTRQVFPLRPPGPAQSRSGGACGPKP